ncbi:nucleotidyltransferase domain-containing protein [Candidatus Woesearchaeota archaeon]|nr:nucleotidyltransferase domain-containing protein [Candidatus Woesearchaeota archaeon]
MYDKLNITENTLQVLSLFTEGFDKEYYIREVERNLKISPRTAQLILEDLENKEVLESKLRGKIKSYKLKLNYTSSKYLTLVEDYKLIQFIEKNLLIKEILEKISPLITGIGVIFGSYAKRTNKKDSDLDIFVAGEYNKKQINRIAKTFGIDISVKAYPMNTFEKNLKTDVFLKEIAKNHLIFLNTEAFINTALKNG